MEAAARPDYSIVITCLNEEASIDEFAGRLLTTIRTMAYSFEVIFVDDGSSDGTHDRLVSLFHADPLVSSVLRLFVNSGQAAAITAGLSVATGRNFVLMDSDLQLDPEELPLLIAEFQKGFDVVSGFRRTRQDSPRRRIYSSIANGILRHASGKSFRDFGCTFKILDGRLVRGFKFGPSRVFRLVDVLSKAGRWVDVPVTHHRRKYGRSGWTLRKLLDLNTENIIALTRRPFQYVALVCAVGSVLLIARVLLDFFYSIRILRDISAGLLLNAIVGSLLVGAAIQALIGELVIRTFGSMQGAPAYIVKEALVRDDRRAVLRSLDLELQ